MWLVFWCEGQEVHPSLVVSSTYSSCWFHNIGRASREADFSLYNTTNYRKKTIGKSSYYSDQLNKNSTDEK